MDYLFFGWQRPATNQLAY